MVEQSSQSVFNYIYSYKPIINYGALFSDGTERFRSPAEPKTGDEVTLRFRTAIDNIDYVYVVYNGQRLRMEKTETDKLFDYYSITLPPLSGRGYYYYEISSGNVTIYYNKLGIVRDVDEEYSFTLLPDFYVPERAKGAVSSRSVALKHQTTIYPFPGTLVPSGKTYLISSARSDSPQPLRSAGAPWGLYSSIQS